MNTVAHDWAWDQPLKPKVKMILVALAFYADDHGVYCTNVEALAHLTGLSPRIAQRSIQELIAGGLLQTQECFPSDSSSTTTCYILMFDGGDKLSDSPVTGDSAPLTAMTPLDSPPNPE